MLIAHISITLQTITNGSIQNVFRSNWLEHKFQNITLENMLEIMLLQNKSNFFSSLNSTSSFAPDFIENINKTLNQNMTAVRITTNTHSDGTALLQILVGITSLFLTINYHNRN